VNPATSFRVVDPSTAPVPVQPPVAVLRRIFEPALAHRPASGPTSGGAPASSPALPAVLRDIEGVRARIDGMLAQARNGRTFSPQELLCLQADSHRFAQTVEFAARAVEHGVQGLRQALNAQV
jgi:hypothetical protein